MDEQSQARDFCRGCTRMLADAAWLDRLPGTIIGCVCEVINRPGAGFAETGWTLADAFADGRLVSCMLNVLNRIIYKDSSLNGRYRLAPSLPPACPPA